MFYKKAPEWLFIVYTFDFDHGNFNPVIQNSVPFITRAEAEMYQNNFINNIENCDYRTQFAIIPIYPFENIKITYTGNSSIRVGKTKALTANNNKSVKWKINSEIGATIDTNGNTAIVKCPDGDFVGKTIIVTAEADGLLDECVLTVVSDA